MYTVDLLLLVNYSHTSRGVYTVMNYTFMHLRADRSNIYIYIIPIYETK